MSGYERHEAQFVAGGRLDCEHEWCETRRANGCNCVIADCRNCKAVRHRPARREPVADKPWSERIPTAIAKGKEKLEGYEIVVVPPHIGGNDTRLTVGITAGEVAMATALWEAAQCPICREKKLVTHFHDEPRQYPLPLIAFTETLELYQLPAATGAK